MWPLPITDPSIGSAVQLRMPITIAGSSASNIRTISAPSSSPATSTAPTTPQLTVGFGPSRNNLRGAPPLPTMKANNTDGPFMSNGKPTPPPEQRVAVQVDMAKAYQTKNPELDAWRQAAMKAGYGAEMGYVEASRDAKDFNMIETDKDGGNYPDSAAAYRAKYKAEPGTMTYSLRVNDLKDARTAMKLGFDSLTDFQRYNTTDDKSSRLTPALKDALLSSTGDRTFGSSTPPLAGLKDRGLASLGVSLSSYTSAVRQQQAGEQNPELTSYIDKQRAWLLSRGEGSPINKDIRDYVQSVDAGARSSEMPGAGTCSGVNVTVGPFTAGVLECSNGKQYGTVGVTTAIGAGVDHQTTAVVPNAGKTVDDVVNGDSEAVTVSSGKLGITGQASKGPSGTTVSAGPALGLGLPAGITKSTTFQIGTTPPQERPFNGPGSVSVPTVRPQ